LANEIERGQWCWISFANHTGKVALMRALTRHRRGAIRPARATSTPTLPVDARNINLDGEPR